MSSENRTIQILDTSPLIKSALYIEGCAYGGDLKNYNELLKYLVVSADPGIPRMVFPTPGRVTPETRPREIVELEDI